MLPSPFQLANFCLVFCFFWQQQVNILVKTVISPCFSFCLHPTITIAPAICSGGQELKLQHRLSLPTPLSLSIFD